MPARNLSWRPDRAGDIQTHRAFGTWGQSVTTSAICAVICVGALPTGLAGQHLRGMVTEGAGGRSLPGVVVYLLDTTNRVVGTALSAADGRYLLRAPGPGTYRVRSMRIGYRPVHSQFIHLDLDEQENLDLALAGIAVGLDTVRVVADRQCANLAGSEASTAFLLWEQTRAALQAALLTRRGPGFNATIISYARDVQPVSGTIIEQRASVQRGNAAPWVAITPQEANARGYVRTDAAGTVTYHVPDLEVLLSPEFLEAHCFRVQSTAADSHVELRFVPVRDRNRIPEIAGVLTMDRRTAELRRLMFEYVNIPADQRAAGAGGTIEFARATDGRWLIARWSVRMPVMDVREVAVGSFGIPRRTERERFVSRVRIEGGELSFVTANADTIWARPTSSIAGTVLDLRQRPVQRASVRLEGTRAEAMTDSGGHFRLYSLLPGDYVISVASPVLNAFDAGVRVPLRLGASDTAIALQVPATEHLLTTVCAQPGGAIVGTVKQTESNLGTMAHVTAEWGNRSDEWRETSATLHGSFRICGVPFGRQVTVTARSGPETSLKYATQLSRERAVDAIDLILSRSTVSGTVVRGTVLDAVNGAPLPNVVISIDAISRRAGTDDKGAYRLADIPAGRHTVTVRRLGYRAEEIVLDASTSPIDRNIALSRLQVIDPVTARADRSLAAFEENRRVGLGQFLDRAALQKQEGRKLGDVVGNLRGVVLLRGPGGQAGVMSGRGTRSIAGATCNQLEGARNGTCNCAPMVYLDRTLLFDGRKGDIPDLNRLSVASIEAIEFYAGPAETPLEYSTLNSQCGVLVIHTRRG